MFVVLESRAPNFARNKLCFVVKSVVKHRRQAATVGKVISVDPRRKATTASAK